MRCPPFRAALLLLLATLPPAMAEPTRFRVTGEVAVPGLVPFTATIGRFGNGSDLFREGTGFEPAVFRNRYTAIADAPDRVVATPSAISFYDTLRTGALDGALVRVYRIENGAFRLVREDIIPEGGFQASSWLRVTPGDRIIPAGRPSARFSWADWNRPGVASYFAVQAVGVDGSLSPASQAVSFTSPVRPKAVKLADDLLAFRPGTGTGTVPVAPTGLRVTEEADGSLRFDWDAPTGPQVAGYVLLQSDTPPEEHQGFFFRLAGGASKQLVRTGDLVMVSKKFYRASRNRLHSSRVWGAAGATSLFLPRLVAFWPDESPSVDWALVPHGKSSPVTEPGETFFELALKQGPVQIGYATHAGTEQDWYQVLETVPYRVEVWLRADRPQRVIFRLTGDYGRTIRPILFDVGTGWKKHSAEFTPPRVLAGAGASAMQLVFDQPGVYGVDNFRVFRADTAWLDYTPEDHLRLGRAALSALRTHAFIKTGMASYDLDQLTNPGGVIAVGTNTLPQTLAVIRKAGVEPWLQVEPHLTPAEWRGLVEYLAAPYDPARDSPAEKPWAAKRHAQGQTRPWADEFPRIRFEIGNETWNQLFRPWTFDPMRDAVTGRNYSAGEVYGLFQEHVIAVMKTSPWWDRLAPKLTVVLGGWNGQTYGADAARMSPSSDELTIAAYNGGWDEKEGPPDGSPASFSGVLTQVAQVGIPQGKYIAGQALAVGQDRGRPLGTGTYEAGPGYALNGLNNERVTEAQAAAQEKVMKSVAAGTATLDAFLARARLGYRVQNFFTFAAGQRWTSHARWYRGGQDYPSWALVGLFDRVGTGDMLDVETLSVPRRDLAAGKYRPATPDAPLAAAYATRSGDRVTLFLMSRKVPFWPDAADDGRMEVEVELPFARADRLTLWRFDALHDADNVASDAAPLLSREIAVPGNLRQFRPEGGLPPGQTLVYVFEGVE